METKTLNLEDQITRLLEQKYGHTIDKDDPLMLAITAQVLAAEQITEVYKKNLESQFIRFTEDLKSVLEGEKIDSEKTNKVITGYIKQAFLEIADSYKTSLNQEFLKAGQEYQKAQKWYKKIKYLCIGSVAACLIIFLFNIIWQFNN